MDPRRSKQYYNSNINKQYFDYEVLHMDVLHT